MIGLANLLYFARLLFMRELMDLATMTVMGVIIGTVLLVSIVLMAIVGGSHVFD